MSTTTFVLVHGAWHDGSCWTSVARQLQAGGAAVLAPDLPGHGNDATAINKITFGSYVTSIVNLIENLPGKVVLVGHSMSGMVISEVASKTPEKISQLVYVCAYLARNGESIFDLIAINRSHEPFTAIELAMQMSTDKRSCTVDEEAIIPLFYNLTPHELAVQAQALFRTQATMPLAAKVSINETILETIPSTYIACSKDKVIPLHHQHRMLNRRTCNTLLQLEADHSPFHSVPEQLTAILEACTS